MHLTKAMLFAGVAFLFFFSSLLLALNIPAKPAARVNDYAEMLSPAARTRLEQILETFENQTSNQIVVATFPSLEGEVLEDFSIRLAEVWEIGQKGKDNGVILFIFKQDRAVRIEVGYGLEGALPDAVSKLIIENEIVPRFRQGQFDEGVERAVQSIIAATKGEYKATRRPSSEGSDYGATAFILGFIFGTVLPALLLWNLFGASLIAMVAAIIAGLWLSFGYYALAMSMGLLFGRLLSRTSKRGVLLGGKGSGWGGGFGSGGGFSGGGFSGGGGSFGGGGASGRW